MLKLAAAFELRALGRGGPGAWALLAFLAVGALALVVGQRHVSHWEGAVVAAEEAAATSMEQARDHLEAGESGPEDRPWVDLAQPMWQDAYAATRIARLPRPLAGIAAGIGRAS